MKLEQKTKEFIAKHHLLWEGAGVLIGLSGGADSVALLEVLCSLRESLGLRLAALHVHHGIRTEAQRDADFCSSLCEAKGIPYYCEYGKVPELAAKWGMSHEEAGRKLRYDLFERYRQQLGFDLIAVAHHQNDQAETMLFQLFRGSGLRGLSGIPVQRDYIIRPLLGVTRKEIESYLAKQQSGYVTDATNLTEQYTRNKLRLKVMPVAEEISAGATEHMSRTAEMLREVSDFLEQQAEQFLEQYGTALDEEQQDIQKDIRLERIGIFVEPLKKTHPALQKMIILAAIEHTLYSRKDITERHVEAILQLLDKEGEKALQLPKGGQVLKRYEQLIFSGAAVTSEEEDIKVPDCSEALKRDIKRIFWPLEIDPGSSLRLPDGRIVEARLFFNNNLENIPKSDCLKWFDYDKIDGCLVLRTREKGDFLVINEEGGRKSLQDYLVNEKVPKSERDNLLVLADGHHIVWVPGMRISSYYKVTKHTKGILQVYIGGEHHGRENRGIDQ